MVALDFSVGLSHPHLKCSPDKRSPNTEWTMKNILCLPTTCLPLNYVFSLVIRPPKFNRYVLRLHVVLYIYRLPREKCRFFVVWLKDWRTRKCIGYKSKVRMLVLTFFTCGLSLAHEGINYHANSFLANELGHHIVLRWRSTLKSLPETKRKRKILEENCSTKIPGLWNLRNPCFFFFV